MWPHIVAIAIGPSDRCVDAIDSFAAVEFVNRMRDVFDVAISPAALFGELPTVAAVARFVAEKAPNHAGTA